ncbi:hypothetical protein Leryth_010666, partial [Lithospermum erythrorhizon]
MCVSKTFFESLFHLLCSNNACMIQIIELGVDIHSDKVQAKYMQIIAELTGINTVKANTEKGTITIVGEVDPFKIIKKIRKAKMKAEIIQVCPAVRRTVPPYQPEVQ